MAHPTSDVTMAPLADILAISTIAMSVIAGTVWLVRLESRINVHEAVCAERYRQLEARHEETTKELRSIDHKLDRLMERA
jgi:hypothetical protein|tara:strand:+ start:39 stop:278 length:240 start_codon:yes stop_codon:yes gene_type:complete